MLRYSVRGAEFRTEPLLYQENRLIQLWFIYRFIQKNQSIEDVEGNFTFGSDSSGYTESVGREQWYVGVVSDR